MVKPGVYQLFHYEFFHHQLHGVKVDSILEETVNHVVNFFAVNKISLSRFTLLDFLLCDIVEKMVLVYLNFAGYSVHTSVYSFVGSTCSTPVYLGVVSEIFVRYHTGLMQSILEISLYRFCPRVP